MRSSAGVLVVVAAVLASAFLVPASATSQAVPVTGHVIVLDPGHGGSDPGSTECPGYLEDTANLDIALQLKQLLASAGATVYLTRETDTYLTSKDRYTFAHAKGAEVLVSIHNNGSTDHNVNGTLGLWSMRNKDPAFTRVLHARLAAELRVPDQSVTNFASGVLLKATMPATIQEGVYISNTGECAALSDGTGRRQQQIAQALYYGLNDWFSR